MQIVTVKAFISIVFVNEGQCRTEDIVEEFDVLVNNDWTEQTIFEKLDYIAVIGESDLFDALKLPEKYGDNAKFSLDKIEVARASRRLLSITSDGIYDDADTELAEPDDEVDDSSDGDSDSDYEPDSDSDGDNASDDDSDSDAD